jgi:hypothetical protein
MLLIRSGIQSMVNKLNLLFVSSFCFFTLSAISNAQEINGRPDLNGVWQTLSTANWNLLTHGAGKGGNDEIGVFGAIPPGEGVVAGNEIPYLPEAAARQAQNFANRWTADPEINCYLPGVPRATYMPYPFQIFQSDNHITFAYQYAGAARIINMAEPTEAPLESWMGWSNGRWEGDTLVIDVTGFNGETWLDRSGNHHSYELHVVERYTKLNDYMMAYEATLEDPLTYTRPWTINLLLYRLPQDQIMEFNCIEYSEELLYGDLRKQLED